MAKKLDAALRPEDVAGAARAHDELHRNATPAQKAIMEEASKAIEEIENIFWSGAVYDPKTGVTRTKRNDSNQLIGWMEDHGVDLQDLLDEVKSMPVGSIKVVADAAFVKTPTQELQEVGTYINRLERTLLGKMQEIKKLQPTMKEEPKAAPLKLKGRVKKAFRVLTGRE